MYYKIIEIALQKKVFICSNFHVQAFESLVCWNDTARHIVLHAVQVKSCLPAVVTPRPYRIIRRLNGTKQSTLLLRAYFLSRITSRFQT